jgi:hypothetical protein
VGRGSFGYLVAQLAVATHIPPQYLLDLDVNMFKNLIQVLSDQAKEAENARRAKGGAKHR